MCLLFFFLVWPNPLPDVDFCLEFHHWMKRCSEQLQMVTSKINYGFRSIKISKVSMIKNVIMMKWREQFRFSKLILYIYYYNYLVMISFLFCKYYFNIFLFQIAVLFWLTTNFNESCSWKLLVNIIFRLKMQKN